MIIPNYMLEPIDSFVIAFSNLQIFIQVGGPFPRYPI